MIHVRKILCPVDFFPGSEAALAYAMLLAKSYKAALHILHVVPPVSSFLDFAQDTGKLVKAAHAESQTRLEKMEKIVKESGIHASSEIRFGEIDREILNTIDEKKANLVVVSTHGRRGFQHWLLGSVCERLLRTAPVPVLTVGGSKKRTRPKLKRVLIGLDLSPKSAAVAVWALSIAQKCAAAPTLVHALDFAAGDLPSSYRRPLIEGVRLEIGKLIPKRLSGETAGAVRVEFGIPHRVILRLAAAAKVDLIVLGAHEKGELNRTILGSNAEAVIRGAPCPVLSVPTNQ